MGVYLIAIFLGVALGFFHKGLESTVSRPRKFWFWGILVVLVVIIGFLAVLLADPFMPGLRLRWYLDALHNNDVEKFLLGLILGILIYLVLARLHREYSFKISDHGPLVAAVMVTLFFAGVFLPDLTDQASRILNIKTPFLEATFAVTKTTQAKIVEKKRNTGIKGAVSLDTILDFKRRIVEDELYEAYTRIKKDRTAVSKIAADYVNNKIPPKFPIPQAGPYLSNWKFLEYYFQPLSKCVDIALSQGENHSVLQHRLAPYAHVLEHISLTALQPGSVPNIWTRHSHNRNRPVTLLDFKTLLLTETFDGFMSFGSNEIALKEWCVETEDFLFRGHPSERYSFDLKQDDLVKYQYFHIAVAQILRFVGNTDRAINILDLISKRFPDSINAHHRLGTILYEHERKIDHIKHQYQQSLNLALKRLAILSKISSEDWVKGASEETRTALQSLIERYEWAEIIVKFSMAEAITVAVTRGELRAIKLSPISVKFTSDALAKTEKLSKGAESGTLFWIELKRLKHFTELVDEAIRENPDFGILRHIRREQEVLQADLETRLTNNIKTEGHSNPTGDTIRYLLESVRDDLAQTKALVGD